MQDTEKWAKVWECIDIKKGGGKSDENYADLYISMNKDDDDDKKRMQQWC